MPKSLCGEKKATSTAASGLSIGSSGKGPVFQAIRVLNQKSGDFTPKMDGENDGKPYFLMDDLGVAFFLETPIPFSGANCLLVLVRVDEFAKMP